MPKTIKLSDIKVEFGGKHPPKDDYLMNLISRAHKGEVLCRNAVIKMDAIHPLTDFKPETSKDFRLYFERQVERDDPPSICVYQRDGKFIMSDDFNAYYQYKEKGYEVAHCFVIGDITDLADVVSLGPPFEYKTPEVRIINEE